jgi:hypothetical protein
VTFLRVGGGSITSMTGTVADAIELHNDGIIFKGRVDLSASDVPFLSFLGQFLFGEDQIFKS